MPTKGGGELVEAETLLMGSISMCWIAESPSRRLLAAPVKWTGPLALAKGAQVAILGRHCTSRKCHRVTPTLL